jgi:uncharacterized protein (TIGR03663 family)
VSEIAAPLPAEPVERRALSLDLRLSWELVAYASIIVVGAGMRFWDLGSRALHHDESLHGFYAYDIFLGRGYEHSPLLHGPFQFFGMALTFFLSGGASDYAVRIMPALFGVALIVLPFFFRDRLGRVGALLASGLIALSPTLLYFSRFARNDIYVAVFTLGIVVCLWRYVDERKPLFLYLGAALLGLSFATKENTFINVAIILVFLNLWLAADLARQSREGKGEHPSAYPFYVLFYLPLAWAITALWPLIGGIRQMLGLRERHPAADFLIVLGTLSLPQFAAGIQLPLESLGYELDTLGREQMVGISTVLALLAATAVVGLRWNWRVWLLVAAAFYIPYALLYTSFLTNTGGFGSGIWESLDYWLGEQQLEQPRGNQPDFYYVMLLPAYEFLALAFAGPALLYFSLRGGPRSWLLTAIATLSLLAFFGADSFSATLGDIARPIALPVAAVAIYFAVRGSPFERFLVFWTAAAIVGYSWVGEKMPWLSVHTTLPVVILAAYSLGRLFEQLPRAAGLLRYAPALLPFAAGVLGLGAIFVAAFGPLGSDTLRIALVATALALLLTLLPPLGRRRLAVVAAAAVFGGLALFSVRTAVIASFEHGDVPREMLVYTQTSPDVPDVMERIEEIAQTSGRGLDLPVIVDNTYTWPWAWYLRDYSITYDSIDEGFEPPPDAVLLVARENESKVAPFLDRYQEPVPYRLRWWFPEEYRSIGRDNLWVAVRDFGESLARGGTWETWWRFFRDRETLADPGSVDSSAYFPLIYDPSAGADIEGRLIIGRSGDAPGALANPSGVAVDGEGNLYVLDSGNARIQKFAPDGRPLKATGDVGSGEGEFNQPADLAIDAEGDVYVIDTWNHRVQKFDADLTFITAWGGPTKDLVNPGDYEMWGPRSIAVDGDGNVWVVDTGTQRVRKFSPDGELLGTVGERGRGLGQFREPVGITFDPVTGDFLVADVGNARIQRFDSEMQAIAVYPIDAWSDLDPRNKPDLAALPDGRILASDPVHGRILLLDQAGSVIASVSSVSGEALAFPRGIAYDSDGGFVITSEGAAGRVRRFPLSDFALR